jgi:hypothetical protein
MEHLRGTSDSDGSKWTCGGSEGEGRRDRSRTVSARDGGALFGFVEGDAGSAGRFILKPVGEEAERRPDSRSGWRKGVGEGGERPFLIK